jgi:hypothetical protein
MLLDSQSARYTVVALVLCISNPDRKLSLKRNCEKASCIDVDLDCFQLRICTLTCDRPHFHHMKVR